jgi:hypothetical protein
VLNVDTSSPAVLASTLEATLSKLIDDARSAYTVAPLAAAIGNFVKLAPVGQEPVTGGLFGPGCSSGSLSVAGASYRFANCELNGHLVSGTSTLTTAGSTYRLDFSGLQVTLAGAASTTLSGYAQCEVATGAVPQCVVQIEPNAPAWTQTFRFGWDSSFANGVANGTHMCGVCDQTWLVQLNDFTATSGSALIEASNGTATIQRVGASTWSGSVTVNGATFGPINGINR